MAQPTIEILGLLMGCILLSNCTGRALEGETSERPALVPIPAGWFVMGSPPGEAGRDDDEVPHPVWITQPLWMMRTEVTQGQWMALMGHNPSHFRSCGADCPVERVSLYEACRYANALSQKEGQSPCYVLHGCLGSPVGRMDCEGAELIPGCRGYRLPTEAEWEYAARAGEGAGQPHGTDPGAVAWYQDNSGVDGPHPVMGKRPNRWGLHDMLGNVSEWTEDEHAAYEVGVLIDPVGPDDGLDRVIRGGAWDSDVEWTRAADRVGYSPGFRSSSQGFRLVRPR